MKRARRDRCQTASIVDAWNDGFVAT